MKLGRPGTAPDGHRYTIWRLSAGRGPGGSAPDALMISMGEHGSMVVTPVPLAETSEPEVLKHNLAEQARAREESTKWEMRLRRSPLGKTQQDFVAYYAEVVALFAEWSASHGGTVPSP